ncbi:MAG: helix-turn-helix domain-containing protein [Clostridia bacterium]|nr:helix-turn-helix domain-containing protein [Clostridia bacterium]
MNARRYWDHNHQMPSGREFEAYHFAAQYVHPVVYHNHPFFEIFFFVSGHTQIVVEGLNVQLSKGDVLIYPPGVMHRNIHLDALAPYERFYLYATRDFLNSISTADYDIPGTLEKMTRNDHYCFHVEEDALENLIQSVDQVIAGSEAQSPSEKLINRYQFSTLLIQAMNMMTSLEAIPQSDYSKGMSELIRFINLHVTEALSLDDLANTFHVNKYYLLREFKNYTGISVHQYMIIRRILVSQEMIRNGAKPKEACFQCGFMDYSSYYRAFKARVGMSPEQFRQNEQK